MKNIKYIAHVDMDAFFASIEQRDDPSCRGKPVVVGSDPKAGRGRGVVSTCSYEARKFGIHSAMPISIAYKKCPHAVFFPVNMDKYDSASRHIYRIFNDFTPHIEPISIDEAFLDITGSFHLFGSPKDICILIKKRIRDETGLTASIGLAPTKMAAKIASDINKPDGFVEVSKAHLLDFLWPLGIEKLWGIGPKTVPILYERGIRTIGDIARMDITELADVFGSNGGHFWKLANGIDDRDVETVREAKSVSNEITFDIDTDSDETIKSTLMYLSEKVSNRLRSSGILSKTITLKIRLKGFKTYTRAKTLTCMTNYADVIYIAADGLWRVFRSEYRGQPGPVRLLGVKASGLGGVSVARTLFDGQVDAKKERVYGALDSIREKFGEESIHRARAKGNN